MNIKEKFIQTIEKHRLLQRGDSVLVGLSGGADSVCLLHLLYSVQTRYALNLYAAHLNHNLRGEAAKQDELFAYQYAKKLGASCCIESINVGEYAKKHRISEESAGRELRYRFFYQQANELHCKKIATAHHKNDNAETVVMHFFRGSGAAGLCGIPYQREQIIRPLLDFTRKEIETYCEENRLSYVTDNSNFETVYTRNKIRLELLPWVAKELNSNVIDTITRNSEILTAENDFVTEYVETLIQKQGKDSFSISQFQQLHKAVQRRMVYAYLKRVFQEEYDISFDKVEQVITFADTMQSGRKLDLGNGICAWISYDKIYFGKQKKTQDFSYSLAMNQEYLIPELNGTIQIIEVNQKKQDGAVYLSIPENSTIIIRNRRAGDYFYPSGFHGKKKLKEYFINQKVSAEERNQVGILVINGEIASVLGYRQDRRFQFQDSGIKVIFQKIKNHVE